MQATGSCRLLLPFGCKSWPVAPPAILGAAARGSPKASTLAMGGAAPHQPCYSPAISSSLLIRNWHMSWAATFLLASFASHDGSLKPQILEPCDGTRLSAGSRHPAPLLAVTAEK